MRALWLAGLTSLACLAASSVPVQAASPFQPRDVVAWLGGSSVVAADQAGLLETAITLAHPGHALRFRCLAWEGDSVLHQPRDLNFPSTTNLLHRIGATVACIEFGALEALTPGPAQHPESFRRAYAHLLDTLQPTATRIVLVVPPPFEPQAPPLPDLSEANSRLDAIAQAIRNLASERNLPLIDLHRRLTEQPPRQPWTFDGREPNPHGHRAIAAAWIHELGFPNLATKVASPDEWRHPDLAALLQAVNHKNRLWFDSWRPMNWAFLAGDRTDQQASRDHRDRNIRWFPAEIESYAPLLTEADLRIESLARQRTITP
jgi:hypothetical protein